MFTLIMAVFVNGQLVSSNTSAPFDDFQACNNAAMVMREDSRPGYGVVALCKPVRK